MAVDQSTFSLADPRAQQILDAARDEIGRSTTWRLLGRPVQVQFPLANTSTEVPHQINGTPDGMIIVTADGHVKRVPGRQWTPALAYLQSDTANSFAIVVFGMLREGVLNVQASA